MKLSGLVIAGFRGVRTKIQVPFGSSFTVICGRNGTGKSTICDAIEFAIRGGISKHEEKKEGGESIADYLWWRGQTKVERQYVQLVLDADAKQQPVELLRTPDVLDWIELDERITDLLCDRDTMPSHALGKLCATSIIRDEDIAKLSMDLSETQRFAYVREALAGEESTSIQERLKDALSALEKQASKLAEEIEDADAQIAEQMARAADLRGKVADAQAVGRTESALRQLLAMPQQPLAELLLAADRAATAFSEQINDLESIRAELNRLRASTPGFNVLDGQTQLTQLRRSMSEVERRREALEQRIAFVNTEVERAEKQAPLYVSLAQLFQAGARLGLLDGACPLCGTPITDAHLREHISNGTKQLDDIGKKAAELVSQRNALQQELNALTLQLAGMRGDFAAKTEAVRMWQANKDAIDKRASSLGLQFDATAKSADDLLSREIERRRDAIRRLEENVAPLKSADFTKQIEAIEADVARRKSARTNGDQALSLLRSAIGKGSQADADIRREVNRLVDERLALLSPLTREFYSRLRPHVAFAHLNYYVRGELRKFLGMRVGDDLNPAFMFSSGQRRAAGMAFLLSLYLARTWCRLRTIILDDPVQHIDDYRALHMTELLAAFCRSGHQVICTVEDAALADLLCRRLRSDDNVTGIRVDMEYSTEDGVKIGSVQKQVPPPRQVLLSA